jgi:hypothetical protein
MARALVLENDAAGLAPRRLEGSLNGEKAIVYYFEARRICQQAQRSDRDECVRSSMRYLLFASRKQFMKPLVRVSKEQVAKRNWAL